MTVLSLFAYRKAALPWSGRKLAWAWGGFLAAAALRFALEPLVLQPMSGRFSESWYAGDLSELLLNYCQLLDVLFWLAFTSALALTAALLRGRQGEKDTQPSFREKI